jgi:LysM repeat protein
MQIVTPTPVTPAAGATGTGAVSAPQENPSTYVVVDGDNLYAIALKFGVDLNALIEANGLSDPNDIQVGQELKIPPKQ